MSTLQWALLLLGAGIAAALIWSSRRERRALERETRAPAPRVRAGQDWNPQADASEKAPRSAAAPPARPNGDEAGPVTNASFDEFGVGKARRRVAPVIGGAPSTPPEPARATARAAADDTVIGLYIAEHEGTNIFGPKIHAALASQGLAFGARRIYHRLENDQPSFSVASLVKPGALDPAEAAGFSTPGLSVFMALPGPARPVAAFEDMLATARQLARALNAELYDTATRQPLTVERERALHAQVEEWSRRNAGR